MFTHTEAARRVIDKLDLDPAQYKSLAEVPCANIKVSGAGLVLYKSAHRLADIQITFGPKATGSTVYIGAGLAGQVKLLVEGPESVVYIGDRCRLKKCSIATREPGGQIFIGNEVTTASSNTWSVGGNAGGANPALIIGDDCMFAGGIAIRTTDAHPVYDANTLQQVNTPKAYVLLEPHVWIGQGVLILKDVTIGACSIVAAGGIVTKSAPRFSVLSGVPAQARDGGARFWARNDSPEAVEAARRWHQKYQQPE